MDKKQTVVLNYIAAAHELEREVLETSNWASQFIQQEPDLGSDPDLAEIALGFQALLVAIKELDSKINRVGAGAFDKHLWKKLFPQE